MPSETMDSKSLSSSLYSFEDISSSTKRQDGFWKSDNLSNCYENSKVDVITTQHESSLFSSSLSELFSRKLRLPANNAPYGHSVDNIASQYEEEMLFDSLEELEAQTIGNLLPNDDDDLLAGLTDGHDHIIQDNGGDDLDELDLFTGFGGMDLGDDDSSSSGQKNSEFHAGACNGELCNASTVGEHFYGEHPSRTLFVENIASDVEDSELKALFEQFGDIHTLDTACKQCGFVIISYYDIRAAQNAMKAHQDGLFSFRKFDIHYLIPKDNPSKKDFNQGTLAVFLYDPSVANHELHHIFNVYGEIKEIHENPRSQHHKLIEFYDVRAAKAALHALNRNDTARKRLKVEPSRPGDSKSMLQHNHPELEQKKYSRYLHQNSPPLKSPTSFPCLHGIIKSGSMDGERILGAEPATRPPSPETSLLHEVSSSVPNTLSSRVRVKSVGNRCGITESSSPRELNFGIQAASAFDPHSLPECHDGLANGVLCNPLELAANINCETWEGIDNIQFCQVNYNGHAMEFNECVFTSSGNGGCPLPGHHYKWSNSYQNHGMMWPNAPSYFDGICAAPALPRLHGVPRSPSHMMSTVLSINNQQHVPSAPAVKCNIWDRQHIYAGESPEASAFHPGSLENMQLSSNATHCVDLTSHYIFPHFGRNYVDLQVLPKNVALQFHNQRGMMFPGRNHMIRMINSFGTHRERARSRRNEGGSNLVDKKQYELDIDRIKKGEDNRTTLMIKNIPNKYTSKMLLAAIDESHKGTYDFVYLPIDFKNKCNVGYAFINMTNPSLIIPFHQVFNGKKWEKFNSEKVASLAYARIQGKAALIAHFQNSSLMNEDKRCRPILFNTDGPNAGDQVPFPVGVNIRNKPGKVRNNTLEDNLGTGRPSSGQGEDCISKESD